MEVKKEFGSFAKYQWSFVGDKPIKNKLEKMKDCPVTIREAEIMAADMKKRGFRSLGATVLYAHMQAVGMVNDHIVTCYRFKEINSKLHSPGVRLGSLRQVGRD